MMTSTADKDSRAPERRSRDAQASRRALLDAARALFDELGYDRATTREIGERAGVDAALIARYFGGKEGLYIATIAEEPLGAPASYRDAHQLVAMLLERWEQRGHSPISRALASPALTDEVREQIQAVTERRLVDPLVSDLVARELPSPRLRAELLIAVTLGLAVTRSNGTLPTLASVPVEELLAVLAPMIDALQSA
jgi:AcrR family transcriptional regulator